MKIIENKEKQIIQIEEISSEIRIMSQERYDSYKSKIKSLEEEVEQLRKELSNLNTNQGIDNMDTLSNEIQELKEENKRLQERKDSLEQMYTSMKEKRDILAKGVSDFDQAISNASYQRGFAEALKKSEIKEIKEVAEKLLSSASDQFMLINGVQNYVSSVYKRGR